MCGGKGSPKRKDLTEQGGGKACSQKRKQKGYPRPFTQSGTTTEEERVSIGSFVESGLLIILRLGEEKGKTQNKKNPPKKKPSRRGPRSNGRIEGGVIWRLKAREKGKTPVVATFPRPEAKQEDKGR